MSKTVGDFKTLTMKYKFNIKEFLIGFLFGWVLIEILKKLI